MFHHTTGPHAGGRCAIHAALGHAALPVACQQFPRVVVIRPHSTAVSFSHYCPTAARLLFRDDVRLAVEADPPSCPADRCREGLDLRAALPPSLRADALFGWECFDRWERFALEILARDDGNDTPEGALGRIARAAEQLREWRVDRGDLDTWTLRCLSSLPPSTALNSTAAAAAVEAHARARAAVPPELCPPPASSDYAESWGDLVSGAWPTWRRVVRRYLATRAWASWVGHESGGVRGCVRALCLSLGVLRVECARAAAAADRRLDESLLLQAVRESDRILVHLVAPDVLAADLRALDEIPVP